MAEGEPGRVRKYLAEQRRRATNATKQAALKYVARPVTVTAEAATATAAGLEVGGNFPIQRAVWTGIQETVATHNPGEIPQAVGHFLTTVHPDHLIPAAVLTVAVAGEEWLRRGIKKRIR